MPESSAARDLSARLNSARGRINWGWPVAMAALVLGAFAGRSFLIVWLVGAVPAVVLFLRASATGRVDLRTEYPGGPLPSYVQLVGWWRHLAGIGHRALLVEGRRVPVAVEFSSPPHTRTAPVPTLSEGNEYLFFMPGQLIQFDNRLFTAHPYTAVSATVMQREVDEGTSALAPDVFVVAQHPLHMTRTGAPNRLFRSNPTVRTARYWVLRIELPSGRIWDLELSRQDVAEGLRANLESLTLAR